MPRNRHTYIDTLLGGPIDGKYIKQMQWQIGLHPESAWCDFVSFDPRLPTDLQMKIHRVHRDGAFIAALEDEVQVFLKEIDGKISDAQLGLVAA